MGIKPDSIPQAMRRCMAPESRKAIGAPTLSDVDEKNQRIAEKELHVQFVQWLNLKGLVFVHSRMDKASTIVVGFPDFAVIKDNRVALIEFKAVGGRLSSEQEDVIRKLQETGSSVLVTTDLGEAIHYTVEKLNIL